MYFKSKKAFKYFKEFGMYNILKPTLLVVAHEKSFASSNSILTIFPNKIDR